jgi:hypothetical protein
MKIGKVLRQSFVSPNEDWAKCLGKVLLVRIKIGKVLRQSVASTN